MNKKHAFQPHLKGMMLVGLSLLVWGGCTNPNKADQYEVDRTALQLSATLPDDRGLRATGTRWDSGDRIGLFAYNSTSTLSSASIVDGADNLPYITGGDGNFRPESKALRTLTDGTLMNLIAYYPYRSDIVGYVYPIDLREQKDVFYSNNVTNFGDATNRAVLHFGHALSQLRLHVTSTTGQSLDGLSVVVENSPVLSKFSLADGKFTTDANSVQPFALKVEDKTSEKYIEGLLLPDLSANTIKVRFSIGQQSFTWTVPVQMQSGMFYEYRIQLDKVIQATIVQTGVAEMPVYASNGGVAPNSIRVMHLVESGSWIGRSSLPQRVRNYSILFDTKNRLPYWVAYPMHPMYLQSGNRTDDWGPDPEISTSMQPNLSKNWSGPGDYNRGHMLASADRSYSKALNRTTFYYTNMAPQDRTMNGGKWAQLEEQVRRWCARSEYDTLYVVTGNILPKDLATATKLVDVSGKQTTVPDYCYKALMCRHKTTGRYTAIAFKMENISTPKAYKDCVVSVAQIEQETGFTFFPMLPADVAKQVKQSTSTADWPMR